MANLRPLLISVISSLAYALAFHYAYFSFIAPTYEYAHFNYFPADIEQILVTYGLLLAPVFLYRRTPAPAMHGAVLIYLLCYIPAQVMMLLNESWSTWGLVAIQGTLAASMSSFFACGRLGWRSQGESPVRRSLTAVMAALTALAIALVIATYGKDMRLVSFEEVYDLRFETSQAHNLVAGYLISWLSYCFVPFFLTHSLIQRDLRGLLFVVAGAVLIYASTGAKAAILMPAIIIGIFLLMRTRRNLLPTLAFALTASLLLALLLPDEGVGMWVKAILLVRILATGGWTIFTYYDYFNQNGWTYYTHIGPINALTGAYPYGDDSLGQVIGLAYSGSRDANFNANFWASDGFAAMGLTGIAIITLCMVALFATINRTSSRHSPMFVSLWLTGFWFALLNLPMTTALLSGGGALTLLLLWSDNLRLDRSSRAGAAHRVKAPQRIRSETLSETPHAHRSR